MRKSHANESQFCSVNGPTDQTLIEAIAGGSQVAMRTLYDRHSTRVYRFLLRIVCNEARAEELLSEVFTDVWKQSGRFEGRSQVATWIVDCAVYGTLSNPQA